MNNTYGEICKKRQELKTMIQTILRTSLMLLCLNLMGCSTLLLSAFDNQGNTQPKTDLATLASIEALILQQPAKYELNIEFKPGNADIPRSELRRLTQWMQKPVKDVVISVGPVRHHNVVQAITISRARGQRILNLLNTFNIAARIEYKPTLSLNKLEVSGWL